MCVRTSQCVCGCVCVVLWLSVCVRVCVSVWVPHRECVLCDPGNAEQPANRRNKREATARHPSSSPGDLVHAVLTYWSVRTSETPCCVCRTCVMGWRQDSVGVWQGGGGSECRKYTMCGGQVGTHTQIGLKSQSFGEKNKTIQGWECWMILRGPQEWFVEDAITASAGQLLILLKNGTNHWSPLS